MLSTIADLIAVSFACLKYPKKPPAKSSEGPMIRRNLLEKVVWAQEPEME